MLALLGTLEPSEVEIELAAELTTQAQELGLPLDAGEAQLVAITIIRGLPLLVTGDKRAVKALSELLREQDARRDALRGRLACFEQVIAAVAAHLAPDELRERICAEQEADTSMRLACSCGREDWDSDQLLAACESFVEDVRREAGDLLLPGSALA
jgi:hypothetical protein